MALSAQVQLVALIAAVAWVVVIWLWLTPSAGSTDTSRSMWWCMPGMTPGAASGRSASVQLTGWIPVWLAMTLAMTLPGELPGAQYVATNTFRRNRSSAVAIFVAVYVLLWLACGLPATLLLGAVRGLPGGVAAAAALLAAASWELTQLKRRALNRCHRGAALPPTGAGRVAGVARFGWRNASGCIASCWPAMLAAFLMPVAQPLAMAGFTVVMTYERLTRRPRTARRRIAAGYIVISPSLATALL
jgi:predicted metal-binding membrane protein